MHPEIHQGFVVYRHNYGPVWIVLHSGHAMKPTARDDSSDVIANMCWKKTGGTMILSNITRDIIMGIDFNRDIPDMERAISSYRTVGKGHAKNREIYKNKYAFVAATRKTYTERAKIYKNLWSYVRNSGDLLVFLHRQLPLMKSYPSVMDLITFNGSGVKKDVLKKIIDDINVEHAAFFKRIEKNFKNITYIEQMKKINILGMKNKHVSDDLKIISRYCDPKLMDKLHSEFNEHNFMAACSNALKNMPHPHVTLEQVFFADKAIGPKKEIIKNGNKVAIEIEINAFMSEWYPRETSKIILELAEKIKKDDEYKKMRMSQKKMKEFL